MVQKPAPRKAAESTPEETTEVSKATAEETAVEPVVEASFTGRWFPVAVEGGGTVLSDNPDDRGRTLTKTEAAGWLGQTPNPSEVTYSATGADGAVSTQTVTPKDGKVTLTVAQFERLAAGAGLTKVDPVA